MEFWLELGKGPLFRLSFILMILGLLRNLLLSLFGMVHAYSRAGDKEFSISMHLKKTIVWLIPLGKLWRNRPLYSGFSFLFHIGLIITPLFLFNHLILLKKSPGLLYPAIPDTLANYLTLLTIICAVILFFSRAFYRDSRVISRKQDFLWPLLLTVPFITGYFCHNTLMSPKSYQILILIHIYSANTIMLLIPFTKIAHCVLLPLSQFVSGLGWKFPAGAGDKVAMTIRNSENPL